MSRLILRVPPLFLRLFSCVILLLTLLLPASAQAMQARRGTQVTHEQGAIPLTVRVEGGYLWGTSFERVYIVEQWDRKGSDLIWKLENIHMLGGVLSAEPVPWLQVNVGLWSAVSRGTGTMDDYDWFDPSITEWTDWSHHDAVLERGWIIDANVQGRFLEFHGVGLWGMAGFKYMNWRWADRFKSYIYSENGFRDDVGFGDKSTSIEYEQWFYTPYVGAALTYDFGRLHLAGYLTYSPLAWARDWDNHIERNMISKSNFDHIRYLGTGVQAVFDITENLYVGAAFDFQHHANTRGTTRVTEDGVTESCANTGGIEHFSHMISFTLGYRF